jgi:hypothetical protein
MSGDRPTHQDTDRGRNMSYEGNRIDLNYYPCRYGASRTVFRGPRVSTDGPYTVVIGGSEVYGKHIEDPFCDQLAERTGRQVLNLGIVNAGVDVFLNDDALMEVVSGAECVIVQAMGAGNMSNRFYSVHPRRNDRFLKQTAHMEKLFPSIDFSDFSFMRHMLHALRDRAPDAFGTLVEELQDHWIARMRDLLGCVRGQRVLLWIEKRSDEGLGHEPLFVTADMMQQLEDRIDKVVHWNTSKDIGGNGDLKSTIQEMELVQPSTVLSQTAHDSIATVLSKTVRRRNGMSAM